MRLLFTTYAERAHLLPMVPLAWACLAAGHQVRIATTPSLLEAVERTGLPAVVVGHDIDVDARLARGDLAPLRADPAESQEEAESRVMRNMAQLQFDHCDAMADDLTRFARAWRPDVVVYDPVTFAGPVSAQECGVPAVCQLYGMARLLRLEMRDLTTEEPLPGYRELFERRGVETMLHPAAWIDPRPPGLRWSEEDVVLPAAAVKNRLPMRYIPYNGPGTAPDRQPGPPDRPRVCVTWGTTQQRKMGASVVDLFREVVTSVAGLEVEVLVTVGAARKELVERLGTLPENVYPVGWHPLNLLLSGCSAIVHTGGTGTVMTAAACAVPQLGITRIREGVYNATQLETTGAGLCLDEEGLDRADVRDRVAALLGDERYGSAARRLRDEIEAQPAPTELVPALAALR
jgi:UDP:flavonoid glycosyltransferase YjiC (YdhE family)